MIETTSQKGSQRKLRVVVVGDYSVSSTQFKGGVQSASAYLVKGLARLSNLEVHVLTNKPRNWNGETTFAHEGVTMHLLDSHPRFERLRNYHTLQSILNHKLAEIQPDLIHAEDATSYAYVALRSGYPTVVTAHGIRREDGKYYGAWGRRLRNIYDSWVIERYVVGHVRHLIAISPYVTAYYAGLLRPDVHIYAIPNAIDDRFFGEANNITEPVILFAGTVMPRKRVMELVQAFAIVVREMPAARLRIAGDCGSEPAYVASVRDWITQANLEKKVDWLGALPEPDLLREFGSCSQVVLPSSQETTPMVLAQAMAASKPVVATAVGGVAEMVGAKNERGLLIQVGDVAELARAILCLLHDPSLCAQMGQAGHTFALENYHLDTVAHRTYQVYEKVVQNA